MNTRGLEILKLLLDPKKAVVLREKPHVREPYLKFVEPMQDVLFPNLLPPPEPEKPKEPADER